MANISLPSRLAHMGHRRSDSCKSEPLASDISVLHFNGTKLKIYVDAKASEKEYPTFVVDKVKKCRDSNSDDDDDGDDGGGGGGSSDDGGDEHDVHAVFECKGLSTKFHNLTITNPQGMNITLCLDPGGVTRLPSSTQTSSPPTDASSTPPSSTTSYSDSSPASSSEQTTASITISPLTGTSSISGNAASISPPSVSTIFPSSSTSMSSTTYTLATAQSGSVSTSSPTGSSVPDRVSEATGHEHLPAIIGGTLSAVAVVLVVIGMLVWRRRKSRGGSRVQGRSHYRDDVAETGTTTKPPLTTWSPDMFQVPSRPPTRTAQNALVAPPHDSSEHTFTYVADAGSQLSSMSPYSSYSSKPLLFPFQGSEDGGRGSLSLQPSDSQVSWHAY